MIEKIGLLLKKYWKQITLLLLVAITSLSLFPLPELPEVPGKDKTFHLLAYAALAFPISWAKPKHLFFILLLFIIYSGVIELIQPYVNRYASWLDFAANSAGVLAGFILAKVVVPLVTRKHTKHSVK